MNKSVKNINKRSILNFSIAILRKFVKMLIFHTFSLTLQQFPPLSSSNQIHRLSSPLYRSLDVLFSIQMALLYRCISLQAMILDIISSRQVFSAPFALFPAFACQSERTTQNYCKRYPLSNDNLISNISEPRRTIQVVAGPRQVGKTTMVNSILGRKLLPVGSGGRPKYAAAVCPRSAYVLRAPTLPACTFLPNIIAGTCSRV